jgi:hypothetical protein
VTMIPSFQFIGNKPGMTLQGHMEFYVSILFCFVRKHASVLHRNCDVFFSYEQYRVLISPRPCEHLLLPGFTAILVDMKPYLTVLWICISLMTKDTKNLLCVIGHLYVFIMKICPYAFF